MLTRLLSSPDAAAYQALRLEGLREAPSAFTASYDEEAATRLADVERRLAPGSGRIYLGVFDGDALIAIARVDRDSGPKQRHRAHIRGVYVSTAHRGKGAARLFVEGDDYCWHGVRTLDGLKAMRELKRKICDL